MKIGFFLIRLMASRTKQTCPAGLCSDSYVSSSVQTLDPFLLKYGRQHPINITSLFPTLIPSAVSQ